MSRARLGGIKDEAERRIGDCHSSTGVASLPVESFGGAGGVVFCGALAVAGARHPRCRRVPGQRHIVDSATAPTAAIRQEL